MMQRCSTPDNHTTAGNTALQSHRRNTNRPSLTSLNESKIDEPSTKNNLQPATESPTTLNSARKPMALISLLGLLETTYLTYDKLHPSDNNSILNSLCSTTGSSSSCNSVLNGPYASFTFGTVELPLASLGMMAYATVFVVTTYPFIIDPKQPEMERINNRLALLGLSTLMGSFSVYLVSLIVGVLHTTCVLCFLSAGFSISLAGLSWWGGIFPSMEERGSFSVERIVQSRKNGVMTGLSSLGIATIAALVLFLSVDESAFANSNYSASSSTNANSGTLLASTQPINYESNQPPPITTKSSPQALRLASDLSSLHSKMYGAFWCSHCYDQKQSLGLQAMQSIPYIECDGEGYRNERTLCREREVPGYPTWEIGGELFPGERSLEELREIVDDVLRRKGGSL